MRACCAYVNCKKLFTPHQPNQKFHSRTCYQRNDNLRAKHKREAAKGTACCFYEGCAKTYTRSRKGQKFCSIHCSHLHWYHSHKTGKHKIKRLMTNRRYRANMSEARHKKVLKYQAKWRRANREYLRRVGKIYYRSKIKRKLGYVPKQLLRVNNDARNVT